MNAPDYVQNTYQRTLSDGLPGTLADANPTYIDSFIAESEGITFGVVVSQGTKFGPPRSAILGGGSVAATAGYMQGAATVASIAEWQAITNGGISVTIDGTARSLTGMDFSSAATLDAVAAVINTKLGSNGTCQFVKNLGCFVITSATTGANSSVNTPVDVASSTSILDALGLAGTPIVVSGIAARTATPLGIVVRSLTVEGGARNESNIPFVRMGDVGAVLVDGTIKVQVNETVSAGGTVYFQNSTGKIFGTAASDRTALGTAKFKYAANNGEIAIVELTGLR